MPQGCDIKQSEWFKTKGDESDPKILIQHIKELKQRILELEKAVSSIYEIIGINPWQK